MYYCGFKFYKLFSFVSDTLIWNDQSSLTPKQKENEFQSRDKTRQQSNTCLYINSIL